MEYKEDFKATLKEYSASNKFKKLMADNNVFTPGSIVITDKQAALKLKAIMNDMYARGRNDEKNDQEWISVEKEGPATDEPIVYCKPNPKGGWHVGIAYWTVSETWNPEMESTENPSGFTHWMPLPSPYDL